MATLSGALQALISLVTAGATTNEAEMRRMVRQVAEVRLATQTGTNAIAEFAAQRARQVSRLVGVRVIADATQAGAATNFLTILIAKRPASAPGTPVNLVTFAMDTATTDDLTAFTVKDLLADATYSTYVPTALYTDFNLLEDDEITIQVTKTGTGMTLPGCEVQLSLEPRT